MNLTDWLVTFFDWSWKASLAASLAFLIVTLLKRLLDTRLTPGMRYALSLLVVLRFVLPAAPPSNFSFANIFTRAQPVQDLVPGPQFSFEPAIPFVSTANISSPSAANHFHRLPVVPGLWVLGAFAFFLFAVSQNVRFSRQLRKLQPVSNPEVLDLFRECARRVHVHQKISLLLSPAYGTPLLFGYFRPAILLPPWLIEQPSRTRLESIFLHELAHIRRRDILWNWLLIAIRSLHWWNPVAWLAIRACTADRELVCDQWALRHLNPTDHQEYGRTLIDIASRKCPRPFPITSSAIINHSQIKRRIEMITKNTKRSSLVLGAVALCATATALVTYTTAANPKSPPTEAVASTPPTPPKGDTTEQAEWMTRGIKMLKEELTASEQKLALLDKEMNEYRKLIPRDEGVLNNEINELERQLGTLSSQVIINSTTVSSLRTLKDQQKIETINAIVQDENLKDLLKTKNNLLQERARLTVDFAEDHPKVRSTDATIKEVGRQIDNQIDGTIGGFQAKLETLDNQEKVLRARIEEAQKARSQVREHKPSYDNAQRNYETQLRIRDTMNLRLLQEMVDVALPRSTN